MVFQEYASAVKEKIDGHLQSTLETWRDDITSSSPRIDNLVDSFIESSKGGKRVRAALVLVGYNIAKGKEVERVLPAAVAVEIFQTAILAHDDIIDKSTVRRGKPSLFASLGGDHYAISQTISLGDAGFFKSIELLAQLPVSSERKVKAIEFFNKTMLLTTQGEMVDVYLPTIPNYDYEDIIKLASLKTASYSFIGPLGLGAILAGGDRQTIHSLEEFGEKVGIAYQLHDDLLGIFGNQDDLGKSVISDIEEGKVTLLIVHAREKATESDKKVLHSLYGKKNISEDEAARIKAILQKTGSEQFVKDTMTIYINQAREIIPMITSDISMQELLYSLTEFVTERKQ